MWFDRLDDSIAAGKLLTEDKYYLANSPSGKVGSGGGGGGGGSDDDDGSGSDAAPKKKKLKVVPKKTAKKKDDDDEGDGSGDDDKPKAKSAASSGGGSGGSGMKKTIMKGSVPVDETNKQGQREGHVLEEKGCIWDAMLNQTDIGNNNNK